MDDLRVQVFMEHGPDAQILSAEKVTQGGIGGFLAKQFYEVTVEVPEPTPPQVPIGTSTADRVGIAALLAEADAADAGPAQAAPVRRASSSSAYFDDVLADITLQTRRQEDVLAAASAELAAAAVPLVALAPLREPGDLVLLVGLAQDALGVARAFSKLGRNADVRSGGLITIRNTEAVTDRRSTLAARADAVNRERAVFLAVGIDLSTDIAASVGFVRADQVWAVVDASRKPDDTRRWLDALQNVLAVDAIAVIGEGLTTTPHSIGTLGLPVGWRENERSSASPLQ